MSILKGSTYYINHEEAALKLGTLLYDFLSSYHKPSQSLVFVCIGSDKMSRQSLPSVFIYGTLAQPVHALNLQETIEKIHQRHPDSFIIAIDASLGIRKHLGYLTISKGALEPGLGVSKKLPPIGDISITGIVNTTGTFDHLSLQMTKLSTIVSMADSIVSGVLIAYSLLSKRPAISTVSQKF